MQHHTALTQWKPETGQGNENFNKGIIIYISEVIDGASMKQEQDGIKKFTEQYTLIEN